MKKNKKKKKKEKNYDIIIESQDRWDKMIRK